MAITKRLGNVKPIKLSSDRQKDVCIPVLSNREFELGKLLNNENLGKSLSILMYMDGISKTAVPVVELKGLIASDGL